MDFKFEVISYDDVSAVSNDFLQALAGEAQSVYASWLTVKVGCRCLGKARVARIETAIDNALVTWEYCLEPDVQLAEMESAIREWARREMGSDGG